MPQYKVYLGNLQDNQTDIEFGILTESELLNLLALYEARVTFTVNGLYALGFLDFYFGYTSGEKAEAAPLTLRVVPGLFYADGKIVMSGDLIFNHDRSLRGLVRFITGDFIEVSWLKWDVRIEAPMKDRVFVQQISLDKRGN